MEGVPVIDTKACVYGNDPLQHLGVAGPGICNGGRWLHTHAVRGCVCLTGGKWRDMHSSLVGGGKMRTAAWEEEIRCAQQLGRR